MSAFRCALVLVLVLLAASAPPALADGGEDTLADPARRVAVRVADVGANEDLYMLAARAQRSDE